MPISVNCPHCGAGIRAKDKALGTTVACPKCKGSMAIPTADVRNCPASVESGSNLNTGAGTADLDPFWKNHIGGTAGYGTSNESLGLGQTLITIIVVPLIVAVVAGLIVLFVDRGLFHKSGIQPAESSTQKSQPSFARTNRVQSRKAATSNESSINERSPTVRDESLSSNQPAKPFSPKGSKPDAQVGKPKSTKGEGSIEPAPSSVKKPGTNSGDGTKPSQAPPGSGLRDNDAGLKLPLHEDFSDFKQDEVTSWGKGAKIRKGADQRNWLVASGLGISRIGLDVEVPTSSYIEFDYKAEGFVRYKSLIVTGVSLIDEAARKFRMDWAIDDQTGLWNNTMALPGGPRWKNLFLGSTHPPGGTCRIVRKGDTVEFYLQDGSVGDSKARLTGNVSDFKKFTRFEIDLYRTQISMFSVTNIKVGKLDTRAPESSRGGRK